MNTKTIISVNIEYNEGNNTCTLNFESQIYGGTGNFIKIQKKCGIFGLSSLSPGSKLKSWKEFNN